MYAGGIDPDPWIPGRIEVGPRTVIEAAATSTTIFDLAARVTARLLSVLWRNNNPAQSELSLGETVAAAWTQRIPEITMLAGLDGMLSWQDGLPLQKFERDIIARASVAAAAADEIQVQCTVKVYTV